MTGTAVNPTLRAAYMAHCTDLKASHMISWHSKRSIQPGARDFTALF
jgi:hypothetical protein